MRGIAPGNEEGNEACGQCITRTAPSQQGACARNSVPFHHLTWVKTLDASVLARCLDVLACKGPAHQAAGGHAVNSVGTLTAWLGLLRIRGDNLEIGSWAKGKQLVVSPLACVFSATARAHSEAPFDVSYCDLEIGSCVDNVVDQHRGPQEWSDQAVNGCSIESGHRPTLVAERSDLGVHFSVEDARVGIERRLTAQVGIEDRGVLRYLSRADQVDETSHGLALVDGVDDHGLE
jgi:hypothetical protein